MFCEIQQYTTKEVDFAKYLRNIQKNSDVQL